MDFSYIQYFWIYTNFFSGRKFGSFCSKTGRWKNVSFCRSSRSHPHIVFILIGSHWVMMRWDL